MEYFVMTVINQIRNDLLHSLSIFFSVYVKLTIGTSVIGRHLLKKVNLKLDISVTLNKMGSIHMIFHIDIQVRLWTLWM